MNKRLGFYAIRLFLLGILIILSILLFSLALSGAISKRNDDTSSVILPKNDDFVVVIDAGHGGEDAGAVADDGTLEKSLNLEISRILFALCELNKTNAVMTRDEDTLLYDMYDDLEDYTGQKKLYDLKNRVRLTKEHEGAVFVSIHMNKFPLEKYYGTQVYYSGASPKSEPLARQIQDRARLYLQNENERKIKRAGTEIYVLSALDCPAVLVECGFLSNQEELLRLKTDSYRAKLALTIFSAVVSRE